MAKNASHSTRCPKDLGLDLFAIFSFKNFGDEFVSTYTYMTATQHVYYNGPHCFGVHTFLTLRNTAVRYSFLPAL